MPQSPRAVGDADLGQVLRHCVRDEVGVVDRPERLTASDDPDGADSLDRTAPPCPNPVGTSPGRARTPREPANIATPFSCSPTETVKALPRRGSIG